MDYGSFWKMKVLKTKSMQTLMFDLGGFLRSSMRLLVFGNVASVALWGDLFSGSADSDLECFFTEGGPRNIIFQSVLSAARLV